MLFGRLIFLETNTLEDILSIRAMPGLTIIAEASSGSSIISKPLMMPSPITSEIKAKLLSIVWNLSLSIFEE